MNSLAYSRAIYNKSSSWSVTKCAAEMISQHEPHCISTYFKHSRKLSSKGFGDSNGDLSGDSNSDSSGDQMNHYRNLEDEQSVHSGQDTYKNSSSQSFVYHTVPRSTALDSGSNGNSATGVVLGQQFSGIDRLHHLYNQTEVDQYASRVSC